MIAREPMRDTSTAIMPYEMEGPVPKRVHQLDHIKPHSALGIVRMVGQAFRLGATAVAAEIGAYHAVALRQLRGDPMPANVRFGIAVEKEHRFTGTSGEIIDRRATSLD
ncbi:MAG: hypothetical protein NVSMB6_32330 [Burkholderiaceae bacterium]